MDLDRFLHDLQFQSDRVIPADWEAAWEDAPLPYKLYERLQEVPLDSEIPLSLQEEDDLASKSERTRLSAFLWYTYGLARYSETAVPSADGSHPETIHAFRRFVPSGGGLYPSELYMYLKMEGFPDGVYHYDAAHHRLLLIREGNFDLYITEALGNRSDLSEAKGVLFVTTMFWKNFFKYNHFAYRLQGLDAGALLGQCREVGSCARFFTNVHFQFVDRSINHLLGLDDEEESIYAVIPFADRTSSFFNPWAATEGGREIPVVHTSHYQRSNKVLDFPYIKKMNQHSMFDSPAQFGLLKEKEEVRDFYRSHPLPEVEPLTYDLAEVCRKRHSPELDFIKQTIPLKYIAMLLKETVQTSHTDLYTKSGRSSLSIYGCFHGVEGLADGAYRYHARTHSLIEIRQGDFRLPLQKAMKVDNVNLHQVPICFHIVGERTHYKKELGYRGYRIQQMEAGMLLQKLLLTASALGMNGHPLLGYDGKACDQMYQLECSGETTLIQIPVGFYRPKSWLVGNMHT
ncbi:SagB/ThcOx family dehydrogenase [Halobacillus aidingensis]|uniref:SagB-type dehydrogenase domain-containing protein n=1 Tax=Halobacillus aidingensis TaxID=240303 RepID=A0A1H0GGY3_HALAD|nr:SagB family peptide dehydrogenase [Halobacillus aidingensis]SDO06134.1 SagB-type dehydrogenase domain-containing protein [Halobacillus aidingensis]